MTLIVNFAVSQCGDCLVDAMLSLCRLWRHRIHHARFRQAGTVSMAVDVDLADAVLQHGN